MSEGYNVVLRMSKKILTRGRVSSNLGRMMKNNMEASRIIKNNVEVSRILGNNKEATRHY